MNRANNLPTTKTFVQQKLSSLNKFIVRYSNKSKKTTPLKQMDRFLGIGNASQQAKVEQVQTHYDLGNNLPTTEEIALLQELTRDSNPDISRMANEILIYHFYNPNLVLAQEPAQESEGKEEKRTTGGEKEDVGDSKLQSIWNLWRVPRVENFIVGNRLPSGALPTDLSKLIGEYQSDCHTYTDEGRQCGMGASDLLGNGFLFQDEQNPLHQLQPHSCKTQCAGGDLCSSWLHSLIENRPSHALFTFVGNGKRYGEDGKMVTIKIPIIRFSFSLIPSKWKFDSGNVYPGYNVDSLINAGCRILGSGQAVVMRIVLLIDDRWAQLPTSLFSEEKQPFTFSFLRLGQSEQLGQRYFVPNEQWKISPISNGAFRTRQIELIAEFAISPAISAIPSAPSSLAHSSGEKRNRTTEIDSSSSKIMRGGLAGEERWSGGGGGDASDSDDYDYNHNRY